MGADQGTTQKPNALITHEQSYESYNFVRTFSSRTPMYGSIQLIEVHQIIPGHPRFDNLINKVYSSSGNLGKI
uniref:Uncharacterized protein n=1 Tax=Meloidogyne incognita TaxID=6306 RepID=A0A914NF08_MELIC